LAAAFLLSIPILTNCINRFYYQISKPDSNGESIIVGSGYTSSKVNIGRNSSFLLNLTLNYSEWFIENEDFMDIYLSGETPFATMNAAWIVDFKKGIRKPMLVVGGDWFFVGITYIKKSDEYYLNSTRNFYKCKKIGNTLFCEKIHQKVIEIH